MVEQQPDAPRSETEDPQTGDEQDAIDPAITERLVQRLMSEQNLFGGALAGFVAALVGAGIWTFITAVTEYQIGWMAVGVGFLVGWSVRTVGKGFSKPFGIIGATMSLVGCLLGNLLTVCYFVADAQQVGFIELLLQLNPLIAIRLLEATFSPMDLLFYGIALYEGYKLSFRQVSEIELLQALQSGENEIVEPA